MMKIPRTVCLTVAAVCIGGCSPKSDVVNPPVQFVQEIMEDRDHPAHDILDAVSELSRYSDIEIVGSAECCLQYAQMFHDFDIHDNVDGSHRPDALPDFAGERLVALSGGVPAAGSSSEALREFASRQLLNALDTTYNLSPYDLEGLGHKNRSKIVVMAEPGFVLDGKRDIDTLLTFHSCPVPVLYPLEIAISDVIRGRKSVSAGFVCSSSAKDSTIYESVLRRIADNECVRVDAVFTTSADEEWDNPLHSFLDRYMTSGTGVPLDVVIVDDPGLDISSFREGGTSVTSVLSPESLVYGRYLSDGFKVVEVHEALLDRCYHLLRDLNLFTHSISFPVLDFYSVISHPDPENSSLLLVPANAYVQK